MKVKLLPFLLLGLVAVIPNRVIKLLVFVAGTAAMASDKAANVELRLNKMWTGDGWKSTSLSPWSGDSLHYRYGMDKRHVLLKFTNASSGSNGGDGVNIANLPPAYRPKNDTNLPLTVNQVQTSSGAQSPHIYIHGASNPSRPGDVDAYGINTSNTTRVNLHATMSIFDDP